MHTAMGRNLNKNYDCIAQIVHLERLGVVADELCTGLPCVQAVLGALRSKPYCSGKL